MARIMIVDDSIIIRMSLKNILEGIGHEIIAEASNGEEACQKYESCLPDLVTMDITMPKMDGITALSKIRTVHNDATVIMISALGQEMKILEALNEGAKSYIVKPFKPQDIIERVNEICNTLN